MTIPRSVKSPTIRPFISIHTSLESNTCLTYWSSVHCISMRKRRDEVYYKNGKRINKILCLRKGQSYLVKILWFYQKVFWNYYQNARVWIDNIYDVLSGRAFHRTVYFPMGTNCALLIANVFPYPYEAYFIQGLLKKIWNETIPMYPCL